MRLTWDDASLHLTQKLEAEAVDRKQALRVARCDLLHGCRLVRLQQAPDAGRERGERIGHVRIVGQGEGVKKPARGELVRVGRRG